MPRAGGVETVAPGSAVAARRHAATHQHRTLARLTELLRFPTVSADRAHGADMRRCASWLARLLGRVGLHDVAVIPGQVAPIVVGRWWQGPNVPTVLVYGHYDVQPAGPLTAWLTDPFEPFTTDDGHLYARGASDDKGQLLTHVAAIEAWLATSGAMPVNLQVVLDGEEEIGSPTLLGMIARSSRILSCEFCVVSDTQMRAPHRPVLVTGLRGLLSATVELAHPAGDVHAGTFGGAVRNPAEELSSMLASLHDSDGRVAIPGFYDDVRPLSAAERRRLARDGPGAAALLAVAGVDRGRGEPGYTPFERTTRRPAVVITDLATSAGGRSVVPASARAGLSVRLVPDQRPASIARLLRRHLAAVLPMSERARLSIRACCPPYTLRPGSPAGDAAAAACRSVFGRPPQRLPSGGSIPFVSQLADRCGPEVLLLGFGLPDDGMHGPNERVFIPNLVNGATTCAELYWQLGRTVHRQAAAQRGFYVGTAAESDLSSCR